MVLIKFLLIQQHSRIINLTNKVELKAEKQKVVLPTEQGQFYPLADGIDAEEETSRIMSAEAGVTKLGSRCGSVRGATQEIT